MDKYEPNSHKSKEEQKQLPKVVQGTVVKKKKSDIGKLADVFIAEDAKNVKNYILMDVVVPLIKNAIEDIVTNGIRMILRGETSARKSSTAASKVSYRSYYESRDNDRHVNQTRTTGYSYEDLIFESRGEAEDVRTRLDEAIDTYGMVSVGDMFDLAGITCNYTDYNYGWTNIRNAEIIHVREGYLLKMPKALPIK